ncbi:hypothetical protein LJR034_004970 [Caballeronia sp. LjRoot34]
MSTRRGPKIAQRVSVALGFYRLEPAGGAGFPRSQQRKRAFAGTA